MKPVLVMGLGRFGGGVAAARWFAERGHPVRVTDRQARDKLVASVALLDGLDVEFRLGTHDPADFDAAGIVVVNQAVRLDNPLVERARAHGASIVTELGLTLRHLRGPLVAVTGTKGKSTTSSLAAAMLAAGGRRVVLGGNIGRPLLTRVERIDAACVVVLEVSSFQLAWLEHDDFRPQAVVVTNLSGDHLDWHGTLEHYIASKERLLRAAGEGCTVVLNADDERSVALAKRLRPGVRCVWYGESHAPPVPLDSIALRGPHNRLNAAAAAHAALAVGATPGGCRAALARFRPLPHRLETLQTRDGLLWVNDSIATTPTAVQRALESFSEPVVLIAGGQDKGLSWGPLIEAGRRAKAVVAFGETGPRLAALLPQTHLRDDLAGAVRQARRLARPGDVVLLSPGFASYDQFSGFDERGELFREIVGGPF